MVIGMISLRFAIIAFFCFPIAEGLDDCKVPPGFTVKDIGLKDYHGILSKFKQVIEPSPTTGASILGAIPLISPGAEGVVSHVISTALQETQKPKCELVNVTTRVGNSMQTILTNLTQQLGVLREVDSLLDVEWKKVEETIKRGQQMLASLDTRRLTIIYLSYVTIQLELLWVDIRVMVAIVARKDSNVLDTYAQRCLHSQQGVSVLARTAKQLLADRCSPGAKKAAYDRYVRTINRLAKIYGKDLRRLPWPEQDLKEDIFVKLNRLTADEAMRAIVEVEKILGLDGGEFDTSDLSQTGFQDALTMIHEASVTNETVDYCITDGVMDACDGDSTCINNFFEGAAYDLARIQFTIPFCAALINDTAWNLNEAVVAEEHIRYTARVLEARALALAGID